MSRTLTVIVIATLFSSTLFGQTTPDPVADLTSQIISRYMPQTTSSSFSRLATTAVDQNDKTEKTQGLGNLGVSASSGGFTFAYPTDVGKAVRSTPMMTPFFSQAARLPIGLQLEEKNGEKAAPAAAGFAMPRLRSFSAASNNGVHAIQAVVPTDKGDEKVELKGTQDEVKTQLDKLSPEIQRVMRRSLGL